MADSKDKNNEEKKPKKAKAQPQRQQPNALVRYFKETRGEIRKVTWPTWQETWRLTLIVLAVSAAMAVFLGLILDTLFSQMILGILRITIGI